MQWGKIPRKDWIKRLAIIVSTINTSELFKNWTFLEGDKSAALEHSLRTNYFLNDDAYLATSDGARDLDDHMAWGLSDTRLRVVPWINTFRPVKGLRILEVGCGTGASHQAFREQGAEMTSIDIHEPSMVVARDRLELAGLSNDKIHSMDVVDVDKNFSQGEFDLIMFSASLEHMTFEERLAGIAKTWDLLKSDGMWAVYECPNRIWFFDTHTSFLPFFNWLPDEVAYAYSKFSPRQPFNEIYRELSSESMLRFLREGRGASYHEFELSLGSMDAFEVVSSLPIFLRSKAPAFFLKHHLSLGRRFETVLKKIVPDVHPAFLQTNLEFLLRKP